MTYGLVRCGTCGTEMVKEYEGGKKKLRASILIFENGVCTGKCRKCGADVPLQVSLVMPGDGRPRKRPVHVVFSR